MIQHTNTEMELVRKYLEMQYVLDVLELEKKKIAETSLRTKNILINKYDTAQDTVVKTMQQFRAEFNKNKIKIYEQNKNDKGIEVKYVCRGYHQRISMLWTKVKVDVFEIIERLL